ncbi:MAG: hypothetical protein J5966_05435 [Lachnospiraceae bacterium]|nr:hypothetical protein [Lachnospiraceae bacterium]
MRRPGRRKNLVVSIITAVCVTAAMAFPAGRTLAYGEGRADIKTSVIADLNDFTSVMAYAQVINAVNDRVPQDVIRTFQAHGGFINIEAHDGNNSGMTYLALDDNGYPEFPDVYYSNYPTKMYISPNDAKDYFPREYVIHEFGHVFDAMYHITADPENRAKIEAEAPAINAILDPYYVKPGHFSTPEEALAQVFASVYGKEYVRAADEVVAAAPETVRIIRAATG